MKKIPIREVVAVMRSAAAIRQLNKSWGGFRKRLEERLSTRKGCRQFFNELNHLVAFTDVLSDEELVLDLGGSGGPSESQE